MTNSPEYGFHTTNIRNYISLRRTNQTSHALADGYQIKSIENGTAYGFFGLPGDYSSPSRFVRATMVSKNIDAFDDWAGISTLYNVFKPLMVSKGISISPDNPKETDYTQYWSGYDINAQQLYVQDYACPTMTRKTLDSTVDQITFTPINLKLTPAEV